MLAELDYSFIIENRLNGDIGLKGFELSKVLPICLNLMGK